MYQVNLFIYLSHETSKPLVVHKHKATKCSESEHRNYKYSSFIDIKKIQNSQPKGYIAKIPIKLKSSYGDIHILLSESNETVVPNHVYEFGKKIF